jgi:hypothetical protein
LRAYRPEKIINNARQVIFTLEEMNIKSGQFGKTILKKTQRASKAFTAGYLVP